MDWTGEWTLYDFFMKTYQDGMYPDFPQLINSQIALCEHMQLEPEHLIVRHFENFTRGMVFRLGAKSIATSDNEGCCSLFEWFYNNEYQGEDLFDLFRNNEFRLSFKSDAPPVGNGAISSSADIQGFKLGRSKGTPFRSEHDLKLSHLLPAAEGLAPTGNLIQRSARFLSPFNIILTPKAAREETGYTHELIEGPVRRLHRNDVGETKEMLDLFRAIQMETLFSFDGGEEAYGKYATVCQGESRIDGNALRRKIALAKEIKLRFVRPVAQAYPNRGGRQTRTVITLDPEIAQPPRTETEQAEVCLFLLVKSDSIYQNEWNDDGTLAVLETHQKVANKVRDYGQDAIIFVQLDGRVVSCSKGFEESQSNGLFHFKLTEVVKSPFSDPPGRSFGTAFYTAPVKRSVLVQINESFTERRNETARRNIA